MVQLRREPERTGPIGGELDRAEPMDRPEPLPLTIRPLRSADQPLLIAFHRALSDDDVRLRFFHAMSLDSRTAQARQVERCTTLPWREVVLIATTPHPDGGEQIVGIGQMSRLGETREAEVALLVHGRFQRRGIGRRLMQRLIAIARSMGLRRLIAQMLSDNTAMRQLCRRMGFRLRYIEPDRLYRAELDVLPPAGREPLRPPGVGPKGS